MAKNAYMMSFPQSIVDALAKHGEPREVVRGLISGFLETPWPTVGRSANDGLSTSQATYLGRLLASQPDLDPMKAIEMAKAWQPTPRKKAEKTEDEAQEAPQAQKPQRRRKA